MVSGGGRGEGSVSGKWGRKREGSVSGKWGRKGGGEREW